jgi:PKD repeat protein
MTSFTDLSTVPGNGIIDTWFWRFGDQNTNNTDQNPQHGYAQWGDYEVTLTVTTADGCVDDTVIAPARVHPKPLAAFSPSIANCHEDTTFFEDLSTLDNFPLDSLVLWQWQFGDGAASSLPDSDPSLR